MTRSSLAGKDGIYAVRGANWQPAGGLAGRSRCSFGGAIRSPRITSNRLKVTLHETPAYYAHDNLIRVSDPSADNGARHTHESAPRTGKAREPNPDAHAHEGVWKPIAAVLGGVQLPEDAVKAITLKVTDGNYEVTIEREGKPDKGTCRLDTTANPKRMTIKGTDGPNRGKTLLAIYEMKDAVSMRVCYDLSGKDFPKEFKAPKGTQLYLVDYRRQSKKQAGTTPTK